MKIALDIMGGDYAPKEILEGVKLALAKDPELEVFLVGKPEAVTEYWPNYKEETRVFLVSAAEVIEMNEHPAMAFRKKKDASITVATKLVKQGLADGVVSAGSTGAQLCAALFVLGRIKGVLRPAIATFLPSLTGTPSLMLDVGANTDTSVENLVQFAWLGSIYAKYVLKKENPEVWLLANGTEEEKGDERTQKTHEALKTEQGINFKGNMEARDLLTGNCEVIVTDGFSGNVALKSVEGTASVLFSLIKEELMKNPIYKLGAGLSKNAFKNVKKRADYEEYGGAPLLGVNGLSVVCHGSSKAKAICTALIKAKEWAGSGFLQALQAHDFENKGQE